MPSKRSQPKLLITVLFLVALGVIVRPTTSQATRPTDDKDDARARELFASIIPVLKHPRCLNCHATGDYPRQGDDSHIHTQNVRRGSDGKGLYGQKCAACHQQRNVAGRNMPPGVALWQLPPARTPMIWEGKTPGEICQQIKDPKRNNGKTIRQVVEHVAVDKLVLWGWNPGEGRTRPPMRHEEFARRFQDWARLGAACPK